MIIPRQLCLLANFFRENFVRFPQPCLVFEMLGPVGWFGRRSPWIHDLIRWRGCRQLPVQSTRGVFAFQ